MKDVLVVRTGCLGVTEQGVDWEYSDTDAYKVWSGKIVNLENMTKVLRISFSSYLLKIQTFTFTYKII